ncbi:hypothetical protein AGLY_008749 [Aphis glycines]|uniref:Uncharacterized protein n=1 Tax=Aphis glycines TaxID=307491 RepID=A0A6G0TJH3_APHGL|nr:hypothetical protein AGLY_008749 [Aphis glycines]
MLIKKAVPMYSYNFLSTIRITCEELCIKFSSILIGPKKFYRHFKKFLGKLKISIYDLYYLNNNKYQKSFEAKPLFNAVLKIYGKSCTKFSKLSYKRKNFYDFPTTKLLANFRNFEYFNNLSKTLYYIFKIFWSAKKFLSLFKKKILRKIENFNCLLIVQKKSKFFENLTFLNYNNIKNRFDRKLVLRKNSCFPSFFVLILNDGKTGIFTQNQFSTESIFLYDCNSKTNHCKYLKFSPNVYVSVIYIQLNFQKCLTFFDVGKNILDDQKKLENLIQVQIFTKSVENVKICKPLKHKPPFSPTTGNYILG